MKKETLLLSNIITDLRTVGNFQAKKIGERRSLYIVPIAIPVVIISVLLEIVWLALLISLIAAYHIVRDIIECSMKKKAVISTLDCADVSISTEILSHITPETIYEPHRFARHMHITKTVTYYYFESGKRWRVPDVDKHYRWSKDCYISSKGLENISIQGEEFYFISLQGHPDIAYIYPCKIFELEVNLRKEH